MVVVRAWSTVVLAAAGLLVAGCQGRLSDPRDASSDVTRAIDGLAGQPPADGSRSDTLQSDSLRGEASPDDDAQTEASRVDASPGDEAAMAGPDAVARDVVPVSS